MSNERKADAGDVAGAQYGYSEYAGEGIPPLEGRDYLYAIDLDFDHESQLQAIHELLKRNVRADEALNQEIRETREWASTAEAVGPFDPADRVVDLLHHSVYHDAALSMSAVGMLAPFIETILKQGFSGLKAKYESQVTAKPNARWNLPARERWDCSRTYDDGTGERGITKGTAQLADATGLERHLPKDFNRTLQALFAYRNAMFHNGLEWPVRDREKFQERVDQEWPADWFSKATTGGEPWVFYMTKTFIDHCVDTAERLLDAFAARVEELFKASQSEGEPT